MLGPFPTHREALDRVADVRDWSREMDRRAVWMSFGTVRLDENSGRVGNIDRLGGMAESV